MKCAVFFITMISIALVHCAEQISPFSLSNTDEDSYTERETVNSQSTDTDSDEEEGSDSNKYWDSDSAMEWDSETDTGSIIHLDSDIDGEPDSGDSSSSDEESDCPGSCQFHEVSSDSLIATGVAGGFYVDPLINFYLICTNAEGKFIVHTENDIPIYDGWILDSSYECSGGRYCCRPQRSGDQYCNETGGTCVPSDSVQGSGDGFCAFPSNTCKEKE